MFNILNLLSSLKGGQGFSQMPNNNTYQNFNNAFMGNNNYPQNFSQPQQQPQQAPVANQQNTQQNQNNFGYPYGEFPTRYTKEGQEALKKQLKNSYTMQNTMPVYPNQPQMQPQPVQQQAMQNNWTQADNNMGENMGGNMGGNQNRGGLDLNSLMPLLGNMGGGKNQADIIKNFLPLLGKGGNLNPNDILKLINKNSGGTNNGTTTTSGIDSYKKI